MRTSPVFPSTFLVFVALAASLALPARGAPIEPAEAREAEAAGQEVSTTSRPGEALEVVVYQAPLAPAPSPPGEAASPSGFTPELRGKPDGRVGGGSRSLGRPGSFSIYALVPDHVARAAQPQPSVFWYLGALPQPHVEIVFTLTDESLDEPLVQVRLPHPKQAGVQRVRLDELGVELEPGVEYEWSIALVMDPDARATDIVVMGWIDRIDMAPAGQTFRAADSPADQAVRLAGQGLWYDALGAVADGLERTPDPRLRALRARLLRQIGLGSVADEL